MDADLVALLQDLPSEELGRRIKAARLAAGLTQPQLAADEVSVTYVSRIEAGARRPGPRLLESFCARLAVTPESLIGGSEKQRDTRSLELQLDLAELNLAGGDSKNALDDAVRVLADPFIATAPHLDHRARLIAGQALESKGDVAAAIDYLGPVVTSDVSELRVKAAIATSRMLRESGDLDESVAVARRALDWDAGATTEGEQRVKLQVTLAAALFESGAVEEAVRLCESAVTAAELLESPTARAAAYWNSAIIESEAGRVDVALRLAKTALALLEAQDETRSLADFRVQLGTMLLAAEPPALEESRVQIEQARREFEWVGSTPVALARLEIVAARADVVEGNTQSAKRRLAASLEAAGDLYPVLTASALVLRGQLEWVLGEQDAARASYLSAVAVLTSIGSDREVAQLWFDLGSRLSDVGLFQQSADAFQRAAASTGLLSRGRLAQRRGVVTAPDAH